ncbi:MAG: YchE family NAAT transporter [Proteobacteria bacterium]|nr:YchE family NAAT transporter [Pseudomonadota bacterium]
MESFSVYMKFFIGLLAIVNPIGTIPIFLDACKDMSNPERKRTAKMTFFTVLTVLLIVLFSGDTILSFFGITINSFRVAGGILLFTMALAMLQARVSRTKQTQEEAQDLESKDSVAIVPLGIPLLAGPGAISTVILYAHQHKDLIDYLISGCIIFVVSLIVWLCLRVSTHVRDVLGQTGINIITRIMGLIMAAIGVEIIASGIKGLFPTMFS